MSGFLSASLTEQEYLEIELLHKQLGQTRPDSR